MAMIDEETGTVDTIREMTENNLTVTEVAVRFDDARVEHVRLDARSIPENLAAGERVRVLRGALYRRRTLLRAD